MSSTPAQHPCTATTTSAGIFRFEDVALGNYVVTVTAQGFKTAVTKGVLVQIGTVASVSISLQPGTVSEEVTVTSSGPTLETESSDMGGVISEKTESSTCRLLWAASAPCAPMRPSSFCSLQLLAQVLPTATMGFFFQGGRRTELRQRSSD